MPLHVMIGNVAGSTAAFVIDWVIGTSPKMFLAEMLVYGLSSAVQDNIPTKQASVNRLIIVILRF